MADSNRAQGNPLDVPIACRVLGEWLSDPSESAGARGDDVHVADDDVRDTVIRINVIRLEIQPARHDDASHDATHLEAIDVANSQTVARNHGDSVAPIIR